MPDVPPPDTSQQRFTDVELDVLSAALANAHDSIIVYERPVGNTRARIAYVNEATVRRSGFSREDLMSGASTGTGPQTDIEVVHALRDAMLRGEPMRARVALYRKDGSMYWGEVDGRPVAGPNGTVTHWISIERDITDAVERERALSALVDARRSLFGVLDRDELDAAFLDAVRTVLEADATFSSDTTDALVARAFASDAVVADGAGRFAVALRPSGAASRVVLVSSATKRDVTNELTVLALLAQTYAAAARNAALFDEVHQQRAAVLELSRMKGDLITMLANDLNNPLTAIRGFAEFLAEEHAGNAQDALATTAIIRATERLVDLGRETLALARLEDNALILGREALDYGALLADIALTRSRDVRISIEGDPHGMGDPVLLRALFDNVIGNAVKFSPGDTPVSVRAVADERTITVEVADEGIGIPAEEIGRVFDRFARASNARAAEIPGTGFGLYFARRVVQRHGGTISIESRVGAGTRVLVRLPRDPPLSMPPRVLVLERDEPAASYTVHVLRDAGYRVRTVHDIGAFQDALASDSGTTAVVPEGAHEALAAARTRGIHVVELRKPFLARDLLHALEAAL